MDLGLELANRKDPELAGMLKLGLLGLGTAQWFLRAQLGGYRRILAVATLQAVLLTGAWVLVMQAYTHLLFWLTLGVLARG